MKLKYKVIARCILCGAVIKSKPLFYKHLKDEHGLACKNGNHSLCYGVHINPEKNINVSGYTLPLKIKCKHCGKYISDKDWNGHLIRNHNIISGGNILKHYLLEYLTLPNNTKLYFGKEHPSKSVPSSRSEISSKSAPSSRSEILCKCCEKIIPFHDWKYHLNTVHDVHFITCECISDYYTFYDKNAERRLYQALEKYIENIGKRKLVRNKRRKKEQDIFKHKGDPIDNKIHCGSKLGMEPKTIHIIYNPVGTKR